MDGLAGFYSAIDFKTARSKFRFFNLRIHAKVYCKLHGLARFATEFVEAGKAIKARKRDYVSVV